MENTILTALNFSKVCRVCLMESDSMFSIYSELFEDNSDEEIPRIHEILIKISSIKVRSDDGLPTMICTKCIDKAHSAYKFQQQCNRSQALLEAYVEQIKELVKIEDMPISIAADNLNLEPNKYNLKPDMIQNVNNDTVENDVLPPELVLINENDLIQDDDIPIDNEDCDALKNCIPLGEDTVDELIKDNLQVDNLELISPKLRAFNLDFKDSVDAEPETVDVENDDNVTKELPPNMNYYRKERDDGTIEYECNVCQRNFEHPNSLRIHLKDHNEDKPYMCTECKKYFKVYGSLMHHIRSHSGEQPYECKECGKRYKQSGTLTAHMRIHTGSKPFLCSICGRGFRQAPDLTYHMRTHTKEKPYMCNICGKRMSMQCHLVQHMRSHTGEKPFKCPECGKAFPSSTRLKRHSIIHTSLKPYKCHICEKCFNRSSSLRVHTKTHLSIRPYVCQICDKAFLWAHCLKGHTQLHTNEICMTPSTAARAKAPNVTTLCSTTTTTTTSTTTTTTTVTAIATTATPTDASSLEFNNMTDYSDSSLDKATNESLPMYSSGASTEANSTSEPFPIYPATEHQNALESFTLYSTDTTTIEPTTSLSSMMKLSAVSL